MNSHQRHIERRLRQRLHLKVPAWLMPGGDLQKKAVKALRRAGRLTSVAAKRLSAQPSRQRRIAVAPPAAATITKVTPVTPLTPRVETSRQTGFFNRLVRSVTPRWLLRSHARTAGA
ncbi:MAG: hypothetical protein WCW26_05585 [Candidatus Buchananbacteria bacterium]